MTPPADWITAGNVLCVRLDNMGDVLMTTPAIRALKTSCPLRRITLLASRSGARLAPFLEDVDDTIIYDAAWVKNESAGMQTDCAMIETLRSRHFDAAAIFTVYSQSALPAAMMCHLAGIPMSLAHSRENPYRLLSHWVRDVEPGPRIRHEVQRQIDLVESIGARSDDTRLSFTLCDADRSSMRACLRKLGFDPERGWIVAHCGASAASRRYGADRFARVFTLLRDCGRPILLTGNKSERMLVEGIVAQCDGGVEVINLAGRLTLGELACLIDEADLLLSNNTGPVHLAAAVQTPVVDLYALTNPQHTPWQVPHRLLYHDVPCKYCYHSICPRGDNACLNGVEPEEVAQAVRELLDERRGNGDYMVCADNAATRRYYAHSRN